MVKHLSTAALLFLLVVSRLSGEPPRLQIDHQGPITADNADDYPDADGAIVGTSLKSGGRVDSKRVARVVKAFRRRGGRSRAGKSAR